MVCVDVQRAINESLRSSSYLRLDASIETSIHSFREDTIQYSRRSVMRHGLLVKRLLLFFEVFLVCVYGT
jgi:hypothetical protein